MTAPELGLDVVAQAIYTWSEANVDGTSGIGFAVTSRHLATSTDWLHRLQPAAFQLYRNDQDGPALTIGPDEFSMVGRTTKDGIGILYCKTASGTRDSKRRPQPVVHALLSRSVEMTAKLIPTLDPAFWIRQISSGMMPRSLPELTLPALPIDWPALTEATTHNCDREHIAARALLTRIAAEASGGVLQITLAEARPDVAGLLEAFPPEVANYICLDPYVTRDGPRYILSCHLPPKIAFQDFDSSNSCAFAKYVHRAAIRYLMSPTFERYAADVLAPSQTTDRPVPIPRSSRHQEYKSAKVDAPDLDVARIVHRALVSVGARNSLTGSDCVYLLNEIRTAGLNAGDLLGLETVDLRRTLGSCVDAGALTRLAQALAHVSTARLIEAWNSTGIASLLGVIIARKSPADGLGDVVISLPGDELLPDLTDVLRSSMSFSDAARNVRLLIERGLGASATSRRAIVDAYVESPQFFFDAVLTEISISDLMRVDFIRLMFEPWSRLRRIPSTEVAALATLWKPSLFDRLKSVILK